MLEEHVAVFGKAACHGGFGSQAAAAELGQSLAVEHVCEIVLLDHFDFLYLVRGAESVKEIDERNR